jgi:hypothetical protein
MSDKIYNKNAREAFLMAEAYRRVYTEAVNGNEIDLTPI